MPCPVPRLRLLAPFMPRVLLASLHLCVSFLTGHPSMSLCPHSAHSHGVRLSLRCPLECQEEQEVCVSALSGSFAIQAGWWAWCSHGNSADQASRGFLLPGIVATGMLYRSQVAWSWVVRGTGLSEMLCGQQARNYRWGSWSPGHSFQESH